MSVTTRYFSSAAAGAGDGTTWADRAALFDGSGNWSTIITGHDFASNARLDCRIDRTATYTCNQQIPALTNYVGNALLLRACNNDGSLWECPDGWSSAQPATWKTELPYIDYTLNSAMINTIVNCYGLRILRSATGSYSSNTSPFQGCTRLAWCISEIAGSSSANGIAFGSSSGAEYNNCVGIMLNTASAFNFVFSCGACNLVNCRAEGYASASSGNRAGFNASTSAACRATKCTALGVVTGFLSGAGAASTWRNEYCTIKAATTGILNAQSGTTTASGLVADQNFIVAGTDGIVEVSAVRYSSIIHNRIRATTPLTLTADQFTDWPHNETAAGSDADEFVDEANGDLRIKNTSAYWGKGFGAGDEEAPVGGGGLLGNPGLSGGLQRSNAV